MHSLVRTQTFSNSLDREFFKRLNVRLTVSVTMDKTFALFYLVQANETVVGRVDWIYKLNLAKSLNNRINRNQTHTIFWSKDIEKDPVWTNSPQVQCRIIFNEDEDSFFQAKIIKCFGKSFKKINNN